LAVCATRVLFSFPTRRSSDLQKLYLSAANLFETYSTTFPTSELREEADFMAAYSYYLLSPTYRLDQTYTERSIDAFQLFVNTFRSEEHTSELQSRFDIVCRLL